MALDRTGRFLAREVKLRRVANQLAFEARREVDRALKRIAALLAEQSPADVSAGRVEARIASLLTKADDVLLDAYRRINLSTKDALVEVGASHAAGIEREFRSLLREQGAQADIVMELPSRSLLRSIVSTQPVEGDVMWGWWNRQRLTTRNAFRTQIQLGVSRGESTGELVRRIRGRSIGGGEFAGGVLDVATRQATALVRTAVTQIANRAAFESYAANPDLTEEYEYVATLDNRTTEICASLDGERFRYDNDAAPRPPQHWNCRSTIIPVVKGVPTPEREVYGDWYNRQPKATQDAILGPARAELIRSGKASFVDLVRSDGSRVPLSSLER